MTERGTPIQRWKKPFKDLIEQDTTKEKITLLQVYSDFREYYNTSGQVQEWVKKGNNLVILGALNPVTAAPFNSLQDSFAGNIKIETRRRKQTTEEIILGDKFGAIVWQENLVKVKLFLLQHLM